MNFKSMVVEKISPDIQDLKDIDSKREILIYDKKIKNYHILSKNESEAEEIFFKEINDLIAKTYDHYRLRIEKGTKNTIITVFINGDLAGMTMLIHKDSLGVKYAEIGVSIVKKEYRKMGIQNLCVYQLNSYLPQIIAQGIPLIAAPRAFSAQSQLQVLNFKIMHKNINIPVGFFLFYFVERDLSGEFVLENDIVFSAWDSLEKVVQKEIFIPPSIILEKKFHLFNPEYRFDTIPTVTIPIFLNNKFELKTYPFEMINNSILVYPEYSYKDLNWNKLVHFFSIIPYEDNLKYIKHSRRKKFTYSDGGSPYHSSIHIERIHSLSFLEDFDKTMKVITICLQMSDFHKEYSKIANVVLMDILVRDGFVPTAQYDILFQSQRTRIAYFTKFQNVIVEAKYEILSPYLATFKILDHDLKAQGLEWAKLINIVKPGDISNKEENIVRKNDSYDPQHFSALAKGVRTYKGLSFLPLTLSISETPFYNKIISEYLKTHQRLAEIIFFGENIFVRENIQEFEKMLEGIPLFIAEYNLEIKDTIILIFHINNIMIKIKLRKKGIVDNELRFHTIFHKGLPTE